MDTVIALNALALGRAAFDAYLRKADAEERAHFPRWEDLSPQMQETWARAAPLEGSPLSHEQCQQLLRSLQSNTPQA